jgi:signal transduction histidine kinase
MKILNWDWIAKLPSLLATHRLEPGQQAARIVAMQRDVVLPSKAGVCLVVLGYLSLAGWFDEPSTEAVVLETLKRFFEIYFGCTLLGSFFFITWRRWPAETFQWLAFTLGLLDGLFMAGMVIVTGGFPSIAFMVFPALIVLNALSIPLAMPQIVLNLLLSVCYVGAVIVTPPLNPHETIIAGAPGHGVARVSGTNQTARLAGTNQTVRLAGTNAPRTFTMPKSSDSDNSADEILPGELLLRASVLWLLTLCCYGAQVLSERQREALQEAAEFAAREGQLHSAGRLAAEFAHQIKNPLAVINNTAYSLKRTLGRNNSSAAQQIEIIEEEVARADKVITQIMGYAQLSEGRVEKLKVTEEVERACEQVFPAAVPGGIVFKRKFSGPFPPLLMQRRHFADIVINLLLNAREALNGHGTVFLAAVCRRDQAVEITVADDGPGIASDKIGRVFEAYFTTKEKGTGLGLAIVKHNAELYGGTVGVESELGKGAKFTVSLPAKVQPKPFVQ